MNIKEELKTAISNNDISFLEKNKSIYSINERFEDEDNDTLLLYSISDNLSNVYEYLLKNNADVTVENNEGENIVHCIVYSGDIKRLKQILNDYSVDINHRAQDGATPLLVAISLERIEIAKSLINNGANVNIGDNDGIMPLHLAVQLPDISLVKLLIENGANLFSKTNQGNLPLALAVNAGHDDVIKFLYEKIYE